MVDGVGFDGTDAHRSRDVSLVTAANCADLRITDVIAHPLSQTLPMPTVTSWGRYSEVSICLVEVRTDAGMTGVGEALARFSPKAYAELIETSLKPRLVGRNPLRSAGTGSNWTGYNDRRRESTHYEHLY